jgi:hypothetical protein
MQGFFPLFGAQHPQVLRITADLARADLMEMYSVGIADDEKLRALEETFLQSSQGLEKVLGSAHPYTLHVMKLLYACLKEQQQLEVETQAQEDDLDSIPTANAAATNLNPVEQLSRKLKLLNWCTQPPALDKISARKTANRYHSDGNDKFDEGDYVEAERLYRLAYHASLEGDDAVGCMGVLNELGSVYAGLKENRIADGYYSLCLEGQRLLLGGEDPSTLMTR